MGAAALALRIENEVDLFALHAFRAPDTKYEKYNDMKMDRVMPYRILFYIIVNYNGQCSEHC